MKKLNAKLFSLIPKDFIKAAIMAGIAAVADIVYQAAQGGTFPMDMASWKHIGSVALMAAVSYIAKNFMTNSKDEFMKKEADAK